jgi:hypothetical protein
MKNIITILSLLIIITISSCGSDPVDPAFSYPQKFTFKGNYEFDKSATYSINSNNTYSKIDNNSGSFIQITNDSIKGIFKYIKNQINLNTPLLHSIELLSKDSIRIGAFDTNGVEQFGTGKADVENMDGIIFPISYSNTFGFNLTYDKANNRLKWCTEFIYLFRKSTSGGVIYNSCKDINFDNRINTLIPEANLKQGDSLSIRYINNIFEK